MTRRPKKHRLYVTLALAMGAISSVAFTRSKAFEVSCVRQDSEIARASTDQMLSWLGQSSDAYDSKDAFTIGGHGAMDRLFNGSGRLIHPRELAQGIRTSKAFVGKKARRVELGVSGTGRRSDSSYAKRLAALLNTEVVGCEGIAYYLSNGLYLCGRDPPKADGVATRLLPIGFTPTSMPMFMAFCAQEGTSPDPRTLLSTQAAFGLFPDELAQLEAAGPSNTGAAFRLYLYHWIAHRDRPAAMQWLTKAAELGHDVARFNLAYENFESGDATKVRSANQLMDGLVAKGFSGPDLRKYYGGTERG